MRATILRTFATTALLGTALVPLAVTAPSASAAPGASAAPPRAMCQGQPATMVGGPGKPLTGTPGRDVIVTRGSGFVDAKGGDDLICITRASASVYAGGGNDRVRNFFVGAALLWVELGAGRDTYIGSRGPEQVWGGLMDDARSWDLDRDVIRTKGGKDMVHTGNSIAKGRNRDQIRLGGGDDKISVNNHRNAGALFDGGAGKDEINLSTAYRERSAAKAWRIDVATGRVRLDGKRQGSYPRMERWSLEMAGESLDFRGTGVPESLSIDNKVTGTVDMGAGDDEVILDPLTRHNSGLSVAGGYGQDRFTYANWLSNQPRVPATFDMTTGAISVPLKAGTLTHTMSGFEDLEVVMYDKAVTITGDDGPNKITVASCAGIVSGGGGNDTITAYKRFDAEEACAPGYSFDGGAGDDYLVGSNGDDTLVGGEGVDHADGLRGTDTCDAETRVNCEA